MSIRQIDNRKELDRERETERQRKSDKRVRERGGDAAGGEESKQMKRWKNKRDKRNFLSLALMLNDKKTILI